MPPRQLIVPKANIDAMIREIRGVRVILDTDLAALYGVPTKRLNEQFRRNRKRFPEDFAFQLTPAEAAPSRSQIATASFSARSMRSQIATASKRNVRFRPWVFTEHGALQAANILNSSEAIRMSVFVIRAFIKMRETLLGTHELSKKLEALEKQLTGRLDAHEVAIVRVLQDLMLILDPPSLPPPPPKPRIGFRP